MESFPSFSMILQPLRKSKLLQAHSLAKGADFSLKKAKKMFFRFCSIYLKKKWTVSKPTDSLARLFPYLQKPRTTKCSQNLWKFTVWIKIWIQLVKGVYYIITKSSFFKNLKYYWFSFLFDIIIEIMKTIR